MYRRQKSIIPIAINLREDITTLLPFHAYVVLSFVSGKYTNIELLDTLQSTGATPHSNSIYTEILLHPKVLRFLILSRLLRFYLLHLEKFYVRTYKFNLVYKVFFNSGLGHTSCKLYVILLPRPSLPCSSR